MRRKSDRSKSSTASATAVVEKPSSRRTSSRRTKRSPSKSLEPDSKSTNLEVDNDDNINANVENSNDESPQHSDAESKDKLPKARTKLTRRRKSSSVEAKPSRSRHQSKEIQKPISEEINQENCDEQNQEKTSKETEISEDNQEIIINKDNECTEEKTNTPTVIEESSIEQNIVKAMECERDEQATVAEHHILNNKESKLEKEESSDSVETTSRTTKSDEQNYVNSLQNNCSNNEEKINLKDKSPSPMIETNGNISPKSQRQPLQTKDNTDISMSSKQSEEPSPKDHCDKYKKCKKSHHKELSENVKPIRKRKWLSRKNSETVPHILAISTDSLKSLISDVQPVPLSDVQLESSSEPEEIVINDRDVRSATPPMLPLTPSIQQSSLQFQQIQPITTTVTISKEKERTVKRERIIEPKPDIKSINKMRKISIVNDNDLNAIQNQPSPPKFNISNILYITNLVRPFTVLQLKGLLARTGKIVETGFWIDKIKSKCYVKYETEDEATETRHALHGIRWPVSNPKCLNVDFGTEIGMEKAIASTEDAMNKQHDDHRVSGVGAVGDDKLHSWEKIDLIERKDVQVVRPIREWDVGKKEDLLKEKEREPRDRDRDRDRNRINRDHEHDRNDRRRRSPIENRDRFRNSVSPNRRYPKKENDPPLRLLDDLFRKTKATPCIYWLPLTPEQIAIKNENRRKHMAEHQRRTEEMRKEREQRDEQRRMREKERQAEREKEREKNDRDRGKEDRSNDRRKEKSRSRDRDRTDRRRH